MSNFRKTTYTFTVISEEPISGSMDYTDILRECEQGDFVLEYDSPQPTVVELTPKEAADALYNAGSQPEFFGIDDDGNPID